MSEYRACGSVWGNMLLWLGVGWLGIVRVRAGYLGLNITQPRQCSWVTVQWWGDDGPYHMLLTPTEILEHGYNVWVPEIQNGTNIYNLTINQPQGLQFVLTMWGASGVQYAGTTDIVSQSCPTLSGVAPVETRLILAAVGAPVNPNATCFLSDQDILDQYTFSFNISDTSLDGGFPAQCSNLSIFWPTSLQSSVQNISERSDMQSAQLSGIDATWSDQSSRAVPETPALMRRGDGSSTSKDKGVTTTPPTLVGIIPLGNSFILPITYDLDSPFADTLPASSLSDNPTTFTAQGITYLNWTVSLAKGTRFILVAGDGSEQAWASGGSSALMTVGQGTTDCSASNAEPSVTSGPGATSTADPGDNGSNGQPSSGTPWGTIVACVLSVVATLVLVGIIWFCCRLQRRRANRRAVAPYYASGKRESSVKSLPLDSNGQTSIELSDHRTLSALGPISMLPHLDDGSGALDSPASDGTARSSHQPLLGSSRSPSTGRALDTSWTSSPRQSAFSPTAMKGEASGAYAQRDMPGGSAAEALLGAPIGYNDSVRHRSLEAAGPSRRLVLHEPRGSAWDDANSMEGEQGDLASGEAEVESEARDDVPDLKRETIAYLGGEGEPGSPEQRPASTLTDDVVRASTLGSGGVAGRRRRPPERETEYVVHRDAGRVPGSAAQAARRTRTVELPPRYDQLELERERSAEGGDTQEQQSPLELETREHADQHVHREA